MFGDPRADFYRRSILDVVGADARSMLGDDTWAPPRCLFSSHW
jgi:hypothetical protein